MWISIEELPPKSGESIILARKEVVGEYARVVMCSESYTVSTDGAYFSRNNPTSLLENINNSGYTHYHVIPSCDSILHG